MRSDTFTPLDDLHATTIGELLAHQAQIHGSKPFILLPEHGEALTFSEVSRHVQGLAEQLRSAGLQRGERVLTIYANGREAAVALLAVMAAGCVAVPLNPRLTSEESALLLHQAGAGAILTDNAGRQTAAELLTASGHFPWRDVPAPDGFVLLTAADREGDAGKRGPAIAHGDDAALILFTSGTTGTPKGVVLSHANLLANASFVRQAHGLTVEDIALCILPLFHINGLVVTLLTPLLTGIPVVLPDRFHADRFWGWVQAYRVTWFSAVPTILSLLLSQPDREPPVAKSLRFARSASAPLPVAVLEQFEQRFGIPVIETYGISEGACQVSANPLPPQRHKPGSAGKPVGNRLQVLDDQGHTLPTNGIGEVLIRGANVFSGYLNNPAADREAFHDGWFRTGDLGYLDEEGYLFLTGRKKELINRAGEKIAPREVEEIIHRLPEVEAVGVVGVPDQLYGEEVAAFVTLRPGYLLDAETVRHFCRKHLAGFKVPREVFFIDEFPKGPSGKIQRRCLVDVYQRMSAPTERTRQVP